MTFSERIQKENNNHSKIFLYYDRGLFFNLVNQSAYAFHTRIKPFKVHVKTLKNHNAPYVTLGFPVSKKNDYLDGLSWEDDGIGCITVTLEEKIDERAYQAWKEHIINQYKQETKEQYLQEESLFDLTCKEMAEENNNEELLFVKQCLKEIQTLNIAAMTPMQTMLFLNDLHGKLKNVKL